MGHRSLSVVKDGRAVDVSLYRWWGIKYLPFLGENIISRFRYTAKISFISPASS